MTSKEELIVVAPYGYQPVNSRWCPKNAGLAWNKILLLSDEALLNGKERKKILFIHTKVAHQIS